MVAFPPGPLTSMGLWVDRAESFKAMGLKLGVYSTLSERVWRGGVSQDQRGRNSAAEEKKSEKKTPETSLLCSDAIINSYSKTLKVCIITQSLVLSAKIQAFTLKKKQQHASVKNMPTCWISKN